MQQNIVEKIKYFLEEETKANVYIDVLGKLSGGAIQENWSADISITSNDASNRNIGEYPVVIRCDAPSVLTDSHSRAEEFELLSAAFEAGVTVPKPLWLGDSSVFGRDFFIMTRVSGTAAGHTLVRDMSLGGDREKLTFRLGQEMARIHSITSNEKLNFLASPKAHPALDFVRQSRGFLDEQSDAYPALEWALNWLENNVPDTDWSNEKITLTHRDFRTGNYMVDENGLTAVLDWEFSAWSHPCEDIGWICARCWRFGQQGADKAVGGIGSREQLLNGYEDVSGKRFSIAEIYYWEVFAQLRWAIIAIRQAQRHLSGEEENIELALTAHIIPELELDLLRMTGIGSAVDGYDILDVGGGVA